MKDQLVATFSSLLENASTEDQHIIQHLLKGLEQKQQGKYTRYIDSTLHMERTFIDDTSIITLPITPVIHNFIGTPHGGIIATIADAAMGELATKSLPIGYNVVTTNMNVNYLQTTTAEKLIAKGRFVRKGNTLFAMESTIEDNNGKLLATASASFLVIQARK